MKAEVVQLAPTVNEAVDYVQDQADPAAVTLIHSGTRDRFERSEANTESSNVLLFMGLFTAMMIGLGIRQL